MIDRFASPFHLLFLIQYLGHRLALLMILMTKATLSKNCSSNQGHLFILPHYASWHSYKTRGCKG